jgi:hypothetical protein
MLPCLHPQVSLLLLCLLFLLLLLLLLLLPLLLLFTALGQQGSKASI